jgi:hypothetical protein
LKGLHILLDIQGLTIKFTNFRVIAVAAVDRNLSTVNQVYYLEVLKRLCEKVRWKQPRLVANNSWILHHNKAPAHTALFLREFLASKHITVLEHPLYSPDLAPNHFFCSEEKGNIERKAF